MFYPKGGARLVPASVLLGMKVAFHRDTDQLVRERQHAPIKAVVPHFTAYTITVASRHGSSHF